GEGMRIGVHITILCALFALATPAHAEKQKKPAAAETAQKDVAKAFSRADKAAQKLAKHPKLKQRMAKHRGSLVALRKTMKELDTLIGDLEKLPKSARSQRKADADKLQAKEDELMESLAEDAIDEAKNDYADAKEQLKLALRVMAEYTERQKQVVKKLTS
ncbi:MAG: hypothetical protein KC731_30520, partial [Myxococcales bacterium]|nr:hypothetical protein [Myxococcales bacterium]